MDSWYLGRNTLSRVDDTSNGSTISSPGGATWPKGPQLHDARSLKLSDTGRQAIRVRIWCQQHSVPTQEATAVHPEFKHVSCSVPDNVRGAPSFRRRLTQFHNRTIIPPGYAAHVGKMTMHQGYPLNLYPRKSLLLETRIS